MPELSIMPYTEQIRDDLIFCCLWAKHALGRVPSIRSDLFAIEEEYFAKGGCFFAALSDGRVVGMLGLLPETAEDAWLKRFYIRPDWKRRGVGRALLSAIISLAREKGFARLHTRFAEGYTEAACFIRPWAFCRRQKVKTFTI